MPFYHVQEDYLHAHIDGCGPRGAEPKGALFRTLGQGTRRLTTVALNQPRAHAMICRRGTGAGVETTIGNHSFRATGIAEYLENGGQLEAAAAMANHTSTRTTPLYTRQDRVTRDDIERVRI